MIGRARHLHDARLFECYANLRAREPLDLRMVEHLTECAACTARYAELTAFMDELAAQAEAETDTVFTAERLRMQQQQIARRLEPVGRAARIISFPRSFAGDRLHVARRAHDPLRWRVGAAAAGLLIGISLGLGIRWERGVRPGTNSTVATAYPHASEHLVPAVAVTPNGTTLVAPMPANDDSFLSDLDVALDRPRFGGELQTFDALTPHVREVRNVR